MSRRVLALPVLVFGVVCLFALGPGAAVAHEPAEPFSPAEKERIEEIVRDYILRNPEIILESVAIMQARQKAEEDARLQTALRDSREELERLPGDPVLGNPDGSVVLVEFFDYQCGYCKAMVGPLKTVIDRNDDLRVVMKEFPILGEVSVTASRASLAAERQGLYEPFHFALLGLRGRLTEAAIMQTAREVGLDMDRLARDMADPEIEARIARNHELAAELGIEGTPAFTIGDQLIPGAVNEAQLAALVDSTRQAGN